MAKTKRKKTGKRKHTNGLPSTDRYRGDDIVACPQCNITRTVNQWDTDTLEHFPSREMHRDFVSMRKRETGARNSLEDSFFFYCNNCHRVIHGASFGRPIKSLDDNTENKEELESSIS